MATYTWDSLAKKYHDWRAPTVSVLVNQTPLLNREWSLSSLQYQSTVDMDASTCAITLGNVYDMANAKFSCEDLLILGAPVEVSLGYVVTRTIFKGYLYEVEYELGEESCVALSCMDVKGAMMENSFIPGKNTYKQAIQSMFTGTAARGYSVLCGEPSMKIPELDKAISFDTSHLDDFGFLRRTAELWGLECFVRDGELLLRKKPAPGTPLLEFSPGMFHSLSVAFSSVGYVHSVKIRGGTDDIRDGEKKRASAEAVNPYNPAPAGSAAARLLKRVAESYAPGAKDDASAREMAEADLRRRNRKSGDVTIATRGLPEIQPGYYVDLKGISPKINGKYYISGVTHKFDEHSFVTNATCRRL